MRIRLSWSLFAATVVLAVTQVALLARSETPLFSTETFDDGFPLVTLAAVIASGVGALILTRYPRHRIGWLFVVGQLGTMAGLTAQAYGYTALTDGFGPPALARVAIWVSIQTGGAFAVALTALLLLLAPDGRLLSQRWRWASGAVIGGLAVHALAMSTIPPSTLTAEGTSTEDSALVGALVLVAIVALVGGLVAGTASLVVRLRRAGGAERAQLRWIASAAGGLAASLPLGLALAAAFGAASWVSLLPLMVSYLALPVFTGVAILRFRLYDIDVLLNRSIVLAVLTAFIAGGYVALVVVLGALGGAAAGSFWPSTLASALLALAFQPMRRRVNGVADRLVYGHQAAPYEALARFSDDLRAGPTLTDRLPRIAEAVARAVGAEHVEVSFRESPEGEGTAEHAWWPAPGSRRPDLVVPIADGETLGEIGVTMPSGRDLRRHERELLLDFAAQAAVSFRSSRLEAELAARVATLARQGEDLERANRRLVTAESVERDRFEAAIRHQVLSHLETMPAELAALRPRPRSGGGEWPREAVEHLLARTDEAIEALRALTRGVFPAQLGRRGLVVALGTHLHLKGIDDALTADDLVDRRFPPRVESVAYFCAVELLERLASPVRLAVTADDHFLTLVVTGPDVEAQGRDAEHLRDRAEAVGGALRITRSGGRLRAWLELPISTPPDAVPGLPQGARTEG